MKITIAFLLGLLAVSFAQTTDSPDSPDSEEKVKFDSQSHEGVSIGVVMNVGDSDAPQVTIGAEGEVYCLTFESIYEAIFDDSTCNQDCKFTVVTGTEVELGGTDAECSVVQDVDNTNKFTLSCGNTDFQLIFDFEFIDVPSPGVEYVITIQDYVFTDATGTAQLVIDSTLEDCSEERGSGSGDDSGDDSDGDRRRLEEDSEGSEESEESDDDESNSKEESDGVSSDDSGEIDVGAATFNTVSKGNCVATDGTEGADVAVKVVFETNNKDILLVIDPFDCEKFEIDPTIRIDFSKLASGSYGASSVVAFALMSLIAVFLV
eukprot:509178_1